MVQMLYVGMGGFVGSIARYLIVGLAQSAGTGAFPYGTLIVNILGCVAIGSISELLETQPLLSAEARAFLVQNFPDPVDHRHMSVPDHEIEWLDLVDVVDVGLGNMIRIPPG